MKETLYYGTGIHQKTATMASYYLSLPVVERYMSLTDFKIIFYTFMKF